MRYAFKQFVINPIEPVKQAGHIQQVDPVSEVHDDLHARVLMLDDNDRIFIHVSCDLLGIRYDFEKQLEENLKYRFDKPFNNLMGYYLEVRQKVLLEKHFLKMALYMQL